MQPGKTITQCLCSCGCSVCKKASLSGRVHIGIGSILAFFHGLTVGDDSYIGKYCTLECDGEIGSGVMLANNVGLIGRYDHDFHTVDKSIYNSLGIGDSDCSGSGKELKIIFRDESLIGYGAAVVSGMTIGRERSALPARL